MKYILPVILLLFIFSFRVMAKDEYTDGYIISNTGDSVFCKIRIPKTLGKFNELELFSKVVVLDSAGNKVKYKPGNIMGYGFVYLKRNYVYVSKVVDDEGKTVFVWPKNLGPKINEYYYYDYNSTNLAKGSMGAVGEVYVLEDDAKQTASITMGGSLINNFKSQLRKFFANDKQVLQLIVEQVKEFHDIPKFVQAANRL